MSFLYNAIPIPTMTREDMKEYFNVAISTSMVIFAFDGEKLRILIQKRAEEPFKGAWQLPIRYVLPNESLELNSKILLEETIPMTNTIDSYSEQLNAFGKVYRNPLGRVINVGFYCIVKMTEEDRLLAEQKGMKWAAYSEIPDLAFDHNEIIDYAKERLKRRFKRRPVGFSLLPKEFTLTQLQILYENALNKKFDKRNFRKKVFNSALLIDLDKTIETSYGKVSKLYKFDEDKYEKMSLKGYDFLF